MAENAKVYPDKRRSIWYVQLYWNGKRYWRGHYDKRIKKMSQAIALRLAEAINAAIDQRGPDFDPRDWFNTPGHEFQFDAYAAKWIVKNRDRYAPSARRQTERYAQMAIDFFGEMDLREIRNAHIERYLDEGIPSGWSPKTKRDGVLAVLHKIFSDAYRQELINRIPGWPKLEVNAEEVKWTTREWQEKTLTEIPERDRPIFQFCVTYGCRPGEARALMWDCVDFEKEKICVKRTYSGAGANNLQPYTKTRRIRYLPFTDPIREMLREIRGIGGPVFRNRFGRPYTADISRTWNDAQKAAGVPDDKRVTLYQGTRHSFATQHLDNLDVVRQVLGHSNANMTMKYQGINTDKIRNMIAPANRKQEGPK
jgi:integrase